MSRPKVRIERGGNRMVIESGGTLALEAGSTFDYDPAADLLLTGNQTVDGDQEVTGDQEIAGAVLLTAGAAAAAVALRLGATATEGLEIRVIDEVVTTTNAVETNLTQTVPSGAVILSVQGNLDSLIVGDGSGDNLGVKVGIGVTADPDKYGITSALTKNSKIDTIPAHAVLSGAETVCVKLAKTDGSAATEKFVAGGLVRVHIVYAVCNSLDDAT